MKDSEDNRKEDLERYSQGFHDSLSLKHVHRDEEMVINEIRKRILNGEMTVEQFFSLRGNYFFSEMKDKQMCNFLITVIR